MRWKTALALGTLALAAAAPAPGAVVKCVNGMAGPYPCRNVDLMAFVPHSTWGGGSGNDIWGWTDPVTGHEWALVGMTRGTAFVDVTDPVNPLYAGFLPCPGCAFPVDRHGEPGGHDDPRCSPHHHPGDHGDDDLAGGGPSSQRHHECGNSTWRDLEVYADHAYIGSEESGHGLVVFDLRQLRNVTNPPVVFSETFRYADMGRSHTITVNTETGFVYANGSREEISCPAGQQNTGAPLMFDASQSPGAPVFVGCNLVDGYTHDSQCVIYNGPDLDYVGREICMNSNEDTLTIVDVTNKLSPTMIARKSYAGVGYTHQGWFVGGQRYFLLDDELDENGTNFTRTYIWDLLDLDNIPAPAVFNNTTHAIDHNQYVFGNYTYQSNYAAGLRVLETRNVARGRLDEIAYFDVRPDSDAADFIGTWANYPFFESGTVVVNTIDSNKGLFVLRPTLADLQLALQPPPLPPAPGQTAFYRLSVLNQGPAAASQTLLDFSLIGGSVVSTWPSQGTCSRPGHRCRLGAVAKGDTATVDVLVRAETAGLRLRASVRASEYDSRPDDNTVRGVPVAGGPERPKPAASAGEAVRSAPGRTSPPGTRPSARASPAWSGSSSHLRIRR